jgi:arginyl-tRNA synthetase
VAYLRREQDLDLKAFDLDFDHYFLESSLYTSGAVDQAVEQMSASGHTYELDGALWLKTTDFGDDKDRVMRKSAGGYTYFVPDVAYHLNKYARGYTHAINIQGTDHHGTIARVRAGLQAVNPQIPKNYPEYVLHTMVRVVKDGSEVKISKRSGSYITLRDLIDWTSSDAVRFLLLSRKADTEFTFDVDLAVSKSNDNPVYYVQYAHARACQLATKATEVRKFTLTEALGEIGHLTEDSETELAAKLANYPELIARAQSELGPHLLVTYLRELAALFHSWYNGCRVIPETLDAQSEPLMLGRLALSEATRQVISNGLGLLGVSAPNKM